MINKILAAPFSCALDVVDKRGDITLDEIGEMVGLTKERIRQLECSIWKIRRVHSDKLQEFTE